jgi:hypothetical protein
MSEHDINCGIDALRLGEDIGCTCHVRQAEHVYDTRALTDDQRSLADDIASAMGWGHDEESCAVWWDEPDGCTCPLLQAVADGLAGARVVEVVQEMGYDRATQRGDRLERRPFRPHPLAIESGWGSEARRPPPPVTLEQIESRMQRALNAEPMDVDLLWATLADVRRSLHVLAAPQSASPEGGLRDRRTLMLTCSECHATVAYGDWDAHLKWHAEREEWVAYPLAAPPAESAGVDVPPDARRTPFGLVRYHVRDGD